MTLNHAGSTPNVWGAVLSCNVTCNGVQPNHEEVVEAANARMTDMNKVLFPVLSSCDGPGVRECVACVCARAAIMVPPQHTDRSTKYSRAWLHRCAVLEHYPHAQS